MRVFFTMILTGLFIHIPTASAETPTEKVVVTSKARMPKKPNLEFNSVPFQLDTLMFTFPSGLRVMFQQDNTLPVVAVTTVFDVGASDDPVTEAGMAHVLEHSWFLSTQEGNTKIWTMQQSDMGCNLNAYTNYDNTVYMSVCPSREMQRLLRLSSKLVLDPIKGVTSDQLTNELEVVRNEIRMRTENGNMPFFPILEFINKHTYGENHQYYKPMAGDHETVRNITLDKVDSWVKEHYRPDNATIMVVGDFDAADPRDAMTWVLNNLDPKMIHPDLTEDQLAYAPKEGVENHDRDNPDHWWTVAMDPKNPNQLLEGVGQEELPVRNSQFADIQVPEPATKEFGRYESTVKDPWVVVTWPLPPKGQGQDILMRMLGMTMNIATNGVSVSRYSRITDIDSNIKAWQGCSPTSGKYGSTMVCAATLKSADKRPDQTAERIINQLYLIFDPDFQYQLINLYGRSRMEMLADILRSLDLYASVGGGRATDIALFAHDSGRPDLHSSQMNEAMTIELPAVKEMMKNYITREKASSFLVTPVDRDDLQSVSGDGSDHYAASNRGASDEHTLPVEAITPEFIKSIYEGPNLDKIHTHTLPNGLSVVIAPHGKAPMAITTLMARGGWGEQSQSVEDFAWEFSSMDSQSDALSVAGQWDSGRNQDHEYLSIKGSSGNLDGLLWMLRDGVQKLEPTVSNKGDWLQRRKKQIIKNFGDIDFHHGDIIDNHINPDHPNGPDDLEDYQRLATLGSSDVQAILNRRWQPSNTTLLIVGNVDPDEALNEAKEYFAGWQAKSGVEPYQVGEIYAPKPVGGKKVVVLDDEGVTQTKVRLTCPGYFNGYDVWPEHAVLGTALRNVTTDILREGSGVVYSPYVGSRTNLTSAQVTFDSNVQNSAAVFALETYYDLLDQVESGSFPESTFRYAQLQYSNSLVSYLQSQDQLNGALRSTLAKGQGLERFGTLSDRLASMDTDSLKQTLGSCKENSIATLVGPKDIVVAQLTEAGIEHEVVDWKQRGYDMHAEVDPKGAEKAAKKRAKQELKDKEKEEEEAKNKEEEETEEGEAKE